MRVYACWPIGDPVDRRSVRTPPRAAYQSSIARRGSRACLARRSSLTISRPSTCARTFGRGPAQFLQLVRARVRGGLHAIAQLAVDLAHQLVGVAREQRPVCLRPGLLPHALRPSAARTPPRTRAERTGTAARRPSASANRGCRRSTRSRSARAVVQQLHHRRDRRVEREPAQVAADLVDRPVGLAQELFLRIPVGRRMHSRGRGHMHLKADDVPVGACADRRGGTCAAPGGAACGPS